MNNERNVSREDALEILFSNRNRAYGAYQLRRQYPAVLARALGITLGLVAILLLLPSIIRAFGAWIPEEENASEEYVMTEVKITPPPPQPLLKTPPPPVRSAKKFVPPVVEDDDKVPEEPPRLDNDDLFKDPADIGAVNVDAPDEGPPTLDDSGDGPGSVIEPVIGPSDDPVEMYDVQILPQFPGGEAELLRYLAKNIRYPDMAREANIQGSVVMSFIVDKDGSITSISVLKDVGGGCGREATRVLNTMPKWRPGESNGHAVKVRFTLPVRFRLQ